MAIREVWPTEDAGFTPWPNLSLAPGVNYQDEPDRTRMLERNRASAAMKRVFDQYVGELDPQLEDDSSARESE